MFKHLLIGVLAVFLVACEDAATTKFIGQWVDATPKNPKTEAVGYASLSSIVKSDSNFDILIEAGKGNKVFVETTVFGMKKKTEYTVIEDKLVDPNGSVRYEFVDGNLRHSSGRILTKS